MKLHASNRAHQLVSARDNEEVSLDGVFMTWMEGECYSNGGLTWAASDTCRRTMEAMRLLCLY